MADRTGWTKEPASRAGWTKEPAIQAELPTKEPGLLDKAADFVGNIPSGALKLANDINETPIRIAANGLGRELDPDQPTGAALRGFGHGASFGMTDKLRGVGGAVDELQSRLSPLRNKNDQQFENESLPEALKKRYEMERDASYREQDTADEKQPVISGVSKVAGAVAAPNPFSKLSAAGTLGRLASGSGQAELYGLGSSRADDVVGKFKDTARSGAVGLAGAAVAELPSALKLRFGDLKAHGAERASAAQDELAAEGVETSRGRFGASAKEPLAAYRTLESEIAAGAATPEQIAEFEAFKKSPLGVATRQRAIGNLLKQLPGHEGQMIKAEGAFGAALANASPEAVKAATKKYLNDSVLVRDMLPRADRLVGNKMLSMIGQFGGAPITTVKNLLNTPGFQHRAGQIGEAIMSPTAAAAEAGSEGAPSLLEPYLPESRLRKRFGR